MNRNISTNEPPQVLRVKRKRTDDPLQALVMETTRRQIKRPRYIFRLKRTEERDIQDSTAVLTASSSFQNDKPVFNIPSNKRKMSESIGSNDNTTSRSSQSDGLSYNTRIFDTGNNLSKNMRDPSLVDPPSVEESPTELNPALLDMLNDYLKDNDETTISNSVKPPKRRQSSINVEQTGRPVFSKESVFGAPVVDEQDGSDDAKDSEYVYDVYYRDKAVSKQWETERIGYIRFDDDNLAGIEEDDDLLMNTDDEDSNDENFYRNDYPEDEDGGYDNESDLASLGLDEPSDDQDDGFDIINDKRRFSKVDFMNTEGLKNMSDDEYQQLAAQIDEKPSLWERKLYKEDEYGDMDGDENMDSTSYMDHDDNEYDTTFERNEFFKSDRDDPIAINRDRIFSKLQRMIDETEL